MSQPIDYKDVRAFSQSSLKLLDFAVTKFYREEYLWVIGTNETRPEYPGSDAMTLGSLVDIILTRPTELNNEYKVITGAPTGQLKTFIDVYFRLEQMDYGEGIEDLPMHIAALAYLEVGIKQSKLETIVQKFQSEGLEYYNQLRASVGKTIVTEEMMNKAKSLVKQLEDDEYTGPILAPTRGGIGVTEAARVVYNQLAIYWEEFGLQFKALLDKVIVDHIKKTVQPYDIKTTGSSDFREAFGQYRYDLQGAFYTDALHHWMLEHGLEKYEILPFIFIVAFTNDKGIQPQLWKMTNSDYYGGRHGIIHPKVKGWTVRGYVTLIGDLLWHKREDKWKYPRDVYGNNGLRELNYYNDNTRR
jgi:hypothetical protein